MIDFEHFFLLNFSVLIVVKIIINPNTLKKISSKRRKNFHLSIRWKEKSGASKVAGGGGALKSTLTNSPAIRQWELDTLGSLTDPKLDGKFSAIHPESSEVLSIFSRSFFPRVERANQSLAGARLCLCRARCARLDHWKRGRTRGVIRKEIPIFEILNKKGRFFGFSKLI